MSLVAETLPEHCVQLEPEIRPENPAVVMKEVDLRVGGED
tara:strand:+ start:868 stop:987 length:120 start_codon:yes stop_codon:yes gene_type:complete